MRTIYKKSQRLHHPSLPEPFRSTCLMHHCETEIPDPKSFPLCERHLAKAWAAYEIANGRPEPESGPDELLDVYDDTTPGAIYFVRVGDLLKIGWTSRLAERLHRIKADAVLHVEQGTRLDERRHHEHFTDHLARGREWFHLNTETKQMLDELLGRKQTM